LQDCVQLYLSFYLEAANRDAFMAIKQDLLVSFVECVEKHGGKLATPRIVVGGLEGSSSSNAGQYAASQ
jgi:MscS family membrane protein